MSCISVLIVDDDKDYAESLYDITELEGCNTHIADSCAATIKLCEKNRFHIAFIDIKLNEEDGTDLAIRLEREYPKMRIFLMTGYTQQTIETQYSIPDSLTVMHKPIKIQTIIHVLNTVCD